RTNCNFIQKISNGLCYVEIWNKLNKVGSFVENTPTAVWQHIGILSKYTDQKSEVIELYTKLSEIYPPGHKFSKHEIEAWYSMLRSTSCKNITPFPRKESYVTEDESKNKETFRYLYENGFLNLYPDQQQDSIPKFWKCFKESLKNNNKGSN
ncbi:5660_t:CDS:2, partial [Entrophospora sp. SA101]